ncbi:MAG: divalent metal cation transporter [Actinomycetota bacterium]|nr:divalent metal cation transporter [Actinomycetota bacterium]
MSGTPTTRAGGAAPSARPGGRGTSPRARSAAILAATLGPGLVVMLADSDAGSLITAAKSGAAWGYAMVLPQILLIPVLYAVQEITVRLGVATGEGHGALIRRHFGPAVALLSSLTLFLSATGALLSEFAAVAGVGEIFGVSRWVTVPLATAFLVGIAMTGSYKRAVGIAMTGSYKRAERIGIALGMAELAFIPAMLMAHPGLSSLARGLASAPVTNHSYLLLLTANIGAVVMPWMIFYQQGAVVDRGLGEADLGRERRDTAIGAVLTQLVTIATVILFAATVGRLGFGDRLDTVGRMSAALQPFLGDLGAKALLGLAMLGAALVAALVASLAAAWGLAEVFGWRHSLNERPDRATAKFYTVYWLAHILGAVVVLSGISLVQAVVEVEVMNALLLPVVLGLLLLLEARALPARLRIHGLHRALVLGVSLLVMAFGLLLLPSIL